MVVMIMVMVRIKKFGCGQEGDGAGAEEESLLNDSLQWRSRSEWQWCSYCPRNIECG